MESLLYGGPETVEHAFEREDSFQYLHVRRRDASDAPAARIEGENVEIWYTLEYDSASDEMRFVEE